MLRVVLDTNIVLSALLFTQGRLAFIRRAWQGRQIVPLIWQPTAAELLQAITYPKFKLSALEQHDLLAEYLPWCDVVEDTSNPPATPACRDPADIHFLQLALVGRADFLVMGDRDILAVSASYPRSIISGAQLLSALEDYS